MCSWDVECVGMGLRRTWLDVAVRLAMWLCGDVLGHGVVRLQAHVGVGGVQGCVGGVQECRDLLACTGVYEGM